MKNLLVLIVSQLVLVISFYIDYRAKRRIKSLEKCVLLFEQIETHISFMGENINELIKNVEYNIDLFFIKKFLTFQQDKKLCERWCESVDSQKYRDCLKNEEASILKSFGELLGVTDVQGQLNNCISHKQMLERTLTLAKNENDKRGNLIMSLGLFGALGIIVMFI